MKKDLVKANELLKDLGAELLPDSKTHKLRVEIKSSSSNKKYIVSRRDTEVKQWECECLGWRMHTPRKPCKHLKAMIPVLEQIQKLLYSSPEKKAIAQKTKKLKN